MNVSAVILKQATQQLVSEMRDCVILIDNSNLWIEGMKFSAADKGLVLPEEFSGEPTDSTWRLDFEALLEKLADGRRIYSAILVGSTPPTSDSVWNAARAHGFDVIVHPRNYRGQEKSVDVQLAIVGTRIIHTAPRKMTLIVGSGDSDFLPLVEEAKREEWDVELCAFSSSFNQNGSLAQAVDRIRLLDDCFDIIGRYETR